MRSLIERVAIGFMVLFFWNAITGYGLMWLIGEVHHLWWHRVPTIGYIDATVLTAGMYLVVCGLMMVNEVAVFPAKENSNEPKEEDSK